AKKGLVALAADCRSGRGLQALAPAVREAAAERLARFTARGMIGRPLRLMIVGIPNVGKSSLINRLAGGKKTKVEDRPGVTRGQQWVKLMDGMEMLDMPGVLWPKFDDQQVGRNLAYTGAVKDAVLDTEELAASLCALLAERYLPQFCARYALDPAELAGKTGFEMLEQVAKKRSMRAPGGGLDTLRASTMLLDEFRGGKIGRVSLETPEDTQAWKHQK
ncbi:MAG: ribosome biogenesis GTPase YlqF, partial [Oscillospiraceae bacterium]